MKNNQLSLRQMKATDEQRQWQRAMETERYLNESIVSYKGAINRHISATRQGFVKFQPEYFKRMFVSLGFFQKELDKLHQKYPQLLK